MSGRDEILQANAEFARGFEWGHLRAPPSRRLSVVTCMDARIDPLRILGLQPGEAHVIRNAGGLVTDDALRSLVISHWELGTQEAFVIGHTDCGLTAFTNETLRRKLAAFGLDASALDFLPFGDLDESIREGLGRIAESPLLPPPYTARGFVYDVAHGDLREVVQRRSPSARSRGGNHVSPTFPFFQTPIFWGNLPVPLGPLPAHRPKVGL